jgi:hypothetical protein
VAGCFAGWVNEPDDRPRLQNLSDAAFSRFAKWRVWAYLQRNEAFRAKGRTWKYHPGAKGRRPTSWCECSMRDVLSGVSAAAPETPPRGRVGPKLPARAREAAASG